MDCTAAKVESGLLHYNAPLEAAFNQDSNANFWEANKQINNVNTSLQSAGL